jgi:hypothetical protein
MSKMVRATMPQRVRARRPTRSMRTHCPWQNGTQRRVSLRVVECWTGLKRCAGAGRSTHGAKVPDHADDLLNDAQFERHGRRVSSQLHIVGAESGNPKDSAECLDRERHRSDDGSAQVRFLEARVRARPGFRSRQCMRKKYRSQTHQSRYVTPAVSARARSKVSLMVAIAFSP